MSSDPRVVALGGGHGLYASLSALRRLTSQLTAIVTVADDGGSSGRIRRELGVLPPGDLRMALVALAGAGADGPPAHRQWARLLQHRFGGSGALAGHPVGNLLLTGLLEEHADPVAALDAAAAMIGAVGRVLPMSPIPLDLVADVASAERDDPVRSRRIRGQAAIAATVGHVRDIHLLPSDAPACPAAVNAVRAADAVVLGPGSWFTSVIPHLLLPELAAALGETSARIVVTLNLVPQRGETDGFSSTEYLRVLAGYAPSLRLDVVVADAAALPDRSELESYCRRHGIELVLDELAAASAGDRHDPARLAAALGAVLGPVDSGRSRASGRSGRHGAADEA